MRTRSLGQMVLALSILITSSAATTATTSETTVTVDSDAAVVVTFTSTASGHLDIDLAADPDEPQATVHYLLYDGASGLLLDAGSAYSPLPGFTHRWPIGEGLTANASYTLVVTGDGTATLDGVSAVGRHALPPGHWSERAFVMSLDWEVNPLRGGYQFTHDFFEVEPDEVVGLALFTTHRDADLSANRSNGHLCFDGRGVTCDEERVEIDDLGLQPVTEDLSVASGFLPIKAKAEGDRELIAEVDVYQPIRVNNEQVAELSIVPRVFHLP